MLPLLRRQGTLMIYDLVVPLAYLALLLWHRKILLSGNGAVVEMQKTSPVLRALNPLYGGFQPKFYWWEVRLERGGLDATFGHTPGTHEHNASAIPTRALSDPHMC